MSDTFTAAFTIVVGEEGGYDANPNDPGNWTSGTIGRGTLGGSNFGISAAAYPTRDIRNLTLDEAQTIYRRDYWNLVCGDDLPPPLALLVFDAAVNNGPQWAVRWLQIAVGADEDGDFGPQTMARMRAATSLDQLDTVCAEFLAQRTDYMANLPGWRGFGLGWARRLAALPYKAISMGAV
jgi:lysozyme family protein